jgi:Protein of unknown function (DUF3995)
MRNDKRAMRFVQVACVIGLIHAGFSLYWALGGRWLLDTVGQWATNLASQSPRAVFAALAFIAVLKATAAIIPMLNASGTLPFARLWRGLSWVGGIFLVLYGGLNTLVAWLVLSGLIQSDFDRISMVGHAAIWDPLFFLWGVFLTLHLLLSRNR